MSSRSITAPSPLSAVRARLGHEIGATPELRTGAVPTTLDTGAPA